MKKLFFIIVGISSLKIALTQPSIKFLKTNHDFGQVANLDYPPASFEFKNTGTSPLAILLVQKNPDVKVSYQTKFVQPGETGRIFVLPDLNEMGPFQENINVLTNASDLPSTITITGTVLSIQQCFPNQNNLNIREVNVINSLTKGPVPHANLLFVHNMQNNIEGITNNQGQLFEEFKIGQYHVQISASGYFPYEKDFFLARSVPVLFFEIDPLIPHPPPVELAIEEHEPELEPGIIESLDNENIVLPIDKYAANNLVFLVDVSKSMKTENKLELLKASVKNLVTVLREIDNVAVISYAENPKILLRSVNGAEKQKINGVINELTPGGITNGVRGLNSAYELALRKFQTGGNNQIILATDGKFTGGSMSPDEFRQMISGYADRGITISIIGFGVDEKAIDFMKVMAKYGRGKYIHVTSKDDISNILIDEIKSNSFIGK